MTIVFDGGHHFMTWNPGYVFWFIVNLKPICFWKVMKEHIIMGIVIIIRFLRLKERTNKISTKIKFYIYYM